MVELVKPNQGDLEYIAQRLRSADVHELVAMHGYDIDFVDRLRASVSASEESWVLVAYNGEPFAVIGVAPVSLIGGIGVPWALGTDGMDQHVREFLAISREKVLQWGRRYDTLFNYVDARNKRSIAYLKRIGFILEPAQPIGILGLPFHRFSRCT